MADSGGHWKTLAEAQKLTQSKLVPGVQEGDVKLNNLLDILPVAQAAGTGTSIKWLREKTTTEGAVASVDIGEQLVWSEDVEYEVAETELKRIYIQRKLDNFVSSIYGTINDYKARKFIEMEQGLRKKVGDKILYGDATFVNKDFDGLHALAAERGTSSSLNIDNGEAGFSFRNWRLLQAAMKQGVDVWIVPTCIGIRIDEGFEELGFVSLASGTAGSRTMITRGWDEQGKPMSYFGGVPIIRSDFLVAENPNTGIGDGADARAKWTAGDRQYSIFGIKFGNVLNQEPGVTLAYGGTEGAGDFYKLVLFPNLEEFDASGMRMISYCGMLQGSIYTLGRIFDIEDVAVTA